MTDHGPDEPDSPVLTAPQGMKLWSVIVTILGDLLPEGDADVSGLVLSALIERMGLQPQAMRVALHRLKRDGWIESRKDGRVGYYRLSDMGRAQAAEVSEAIYGGAVPSRARPMLAILAPEMQPDAVQGAVPLSRQACLLPDGALPEGALAVPLGPAQLPAWAAAIVAREARLTGYAATLALAEGFLADIRRNRALPLTDRVAQRMLVLHSWRRLVLRSNPLAVALAGEVPADCRRAVMELFSALPRPPIGDLADAVASGQ
ncbi:MAG: transcriptional repressor of phenylacetic acid degradation PaaX [Rhodobacteraceae bacterium HLUCCA08]|nr:MAG: transcriptional repressor of phenylacetic acid degradation PaaX [Rhodobacteraceae bacterium HLUCCA08]